MSKPMIFASDTAFNRLANKGAVVTARTEKKQMQDVWVRRSRTGPKEFDAFVVPIEYARVTPAGLQEYADRSGFDSVEDWIAEIQNQHGVEEGDTVYLHEVVRNPDSDDA